jgi:hypothetical protein
VPRRGTPDPLHGRAQLALEVVEHAAAVAGLEEELGVHDGGLPAADEEGHDRLGEVHVGDGAAAAERGDRGELVGGLGALGPGRLRRQRQQRGQYWQQTSNDSRGRRPAGPA